MAAAPRRRPRLRPGVLLRRSAHQTATSQPAAIGSYRTTFRLLLSFAQRELHKRPSALDLADLDAPLITVFLALSNKTGTIRCKPQCRLAAIRSMFRYAALRHPECSALIQQVLGVADKRCERTLMTFITDAEANALIVAPDGRARTGRRDHALLAVAVQTQLRNSELTGLTCGDVLLGHGAHLRCVGNGRKERCTPLTSATASLVSTWRAEIGNMASAPLFPTIRNTRLSADAVQQLVAKHVKAASGTCPSLLDRHVTPHTLRHTAAMGLIHAGVDPVVISLWLGHESIQSTNVYVPADMTLKERALDRTVPIAVRLGRYRAPDPLLAFPEAL